MQVEPGAEGAQPGRRRVDERQRPKKLPCGHILHFSCLRSWLERQQVCPTCRRPVLAQSPTTNNAQNQPNAGQANPAAFPIGNLPAPPAAPGQPGQQPAAQPGQQNQPQGNVRVFNFGPIRLALGNMRLPANRPADANPNPINNNNLLMERLAQQIAQQPNPLQPQLQNHNLNIPLQMPNALTPVTGAGVPQHPNDIQGDILRLQQNIIASIQQLNAQHAQLEHIHALLAELNRLQQASGAAATGQDLPPIASLNPQPFPQTNPQAYFPNGPVLRQGDAGIPQGLTLPDGWTLRPMSLATQPTPTPTPTTTTTTTQPPSTVAGPSGTTGSLASVLASASAAALSSSSTSASTSASAPRPPPSNRSSPPPPSPPLASSSSTATATPLANPAEPSSLGSSWSFDSVGQGQGQGLGHANANANTNTNVNVNASGNGSGSASASGTSSGPSNTNTNPNPNPTPDTTADAFPSRTQPPRACFQCRMGRMACIGGVAGEACRGCRSAGRRCEFEEEDDEDEDDEDDEEEEE